MKTKTRLTALMYALLVMIFLVASYSTYDAFTSQFETKETLEAMGCWFLAGISLGWETSRFIKSGIRTGRSKDFGRIQ